MSGTLKLHRTPLHRAEQTAGTPFGGGADVAYDGDQKLATVTWSPVRDFVRRLAHRRLGRADMADDVAQETLLRLIEYQRGGRIDNLYVDRRGKGTPLAV
ncbi:sigma factor [Brevundimonas mediterranea]|nr:sigma factor [Brevundimonas mediterranea]